MLPRVLFIQLLQADRDAATGTDVQGAMQETFRGGGIDK